MINLKWHKLGNDKKTYLRSANKTFILAPTIVRKERFKNLLEEIYKDYDLIIIGVLLDEWIPGLGGGEPFRPATFDEVKEAVEECNEEIQNKVLLLEYSFKHLKYIIRELSPQKIIAFNGTWKNIIHYQDFWWEAYDLDVKIEKVSPFIDEKDARKFSEQLTEKLEKDFDKKWPKDKEYKVKDLREMLNELSYLSWDWTGRVSAIITQKESDDKYKIITRSYNKVVPYPSYMLNEGSLREKNHSEIGSNIELEETVHAETGCLSQLAEQKISLENTQLWVQTFPCPCCARLIASSPIIEIKYFNEYTNPLGYELLEKAGKKVENIRD